MSGCELHEHQFNFYCKRAGNFSIDTVYSGKRQLYKNNNNSITQRIYTNNNNSVLQQVKHIKRPYPAD